MEIQNSRGWKGSPCSNHGQLEQVAQDHVQSVTPLSNSKDEEFITSLHSVFQYLITLTVKKGF